MICSTCGSDNRPGRRFCSNCGSTLAVVCPVCSASNEPSDKFCGQCGTTLAGSTDGAAPKLTTAGPDPGRVAERRLVSVLFADLVGFTPYSEGRDAEDVRSMLSRYFEFATDIVERYGGTVEKFIGDAVMAVWGTPTAHEDDAERAVRAALELVDIVPTLGDGLAARAGVLTGETAVTIGAEREGMVIGDIVNTAARLQSAAPEGAVVVGESTYRATAASIVYEAAGGQVLKGKAAPVSAWRALRIIASRHGAGRSDLPEPPFVGRDDELRALKEALHATGRERRPRLVSVTGPGGIGKSRLAAEFENHTDGLVEDTYWHRGRCPAYGDGITFWALGEMVRRRARLAESDDETTTRDRIAATVAEYIDAPDDRAWVEPALLTLLGVQTGAATSREVLFAAWRIFFERIAARGTTVLLFEDLQWADSGLLDFIDHLLEWSKGVPILVITLARPELFDRRPDWGTTTRSLTTLSLAPLSDAAMRDLLGGFATGLPADAVDHIVAHAEGTPLYAVEMVRSLVTDGRLAFVDGAYRPTRDLGTITIPETLRSLIASRMDALDPVDRGLVLDASVLGQVFTLQGLAAVSGRTAAELEARLRGLIRRELFQLEADPQSPERGQFRFVQGLIREVAYGQLAKSDRRARHLAAARFLEAMGGEELAGALANHYLAAHAVSASGAEAEAVAIQARIALRAAGVRASELGAHAQAVTYFRQALDVATDPADRVALLMDAAWSADRATHYDVAEAQLREAITTYRELGDASGAGAAQALLGEVLVNDANVTGALAVIEPALAALPADADEPRARLLTSLSRALYRDDQNTRAAEVADQALAMAERLGLQDLIAEGFINKGAALDTIGRHREARVLQEAATVLTKDLGMVGSHLRSLANLANTIGDSDPRGSLAVMDEALELAMRVGDRGMGDWIRWIRATLQVDLGDDWDVPLADMEDRTAAAETPNAAMRPLFTAANIRLLRGEPEGEAYLQRFAANANQTGDVTAVHAIPVLQARSAATKGDFAGATTILLDATSQAEWIAEIALPFATHTAALSRDPLMVRRLIATEDATPLSHLLIATERRAAAAALAALDGRTADAVEGYRAVLATWDGLGLYTEFAFTALDFVTLVGPQEPAARDAAAQARVILERLRATPFLEFLDAASAGTPDGASAGGRSRVADRAPA